MRAWEIISNGGIDALNLADRADPTPGPYEVLVRVKASSLNYRDLMTVEDPEARKLPYPTVPNSDGAGEVVAIGPGVTRFAVGDRVMGCFFQGWVDGPITAADMGRALGGTYDGMLAELVALHENGLVHIPEHLSDAEAATLPCAGVTAWHSLVEIGRVKPGETVLLLGTGGVSILALQFCRAMGVRTIVTSSSEEKLARARSMGAWRTVNYRENPDWEGPVLELTNGIGVDHAVEVGGAGTLDKSVLATKVGGSIGMIGVLTGGTANPTAIMRKSIRLQGIYVGSRRMFEDMNRAIDHHKIRPIVDKSYTMEDARDAYHAMRSAGHFGKIVVGL